MIITLHLCGPEGEALRQQLTNMLNALKRDNRYVINAMINSGMEVPDTVIDAGLEYVPSQHRQLDYGEPIQDFYGMKAMFDSGTFSCGDAAAYEAAVLEEKYGIPTEVLCVALSDEDYHSLLVTPYDVVDPTENWITFKNSHQLPKPPQSRSKKKSNPLDANCRVVDGKVACDVKTDRGCCVDARKKVWRCKNPHLNGKPVRIKSIFRGKRTNQRWARTYDGMLVPVCSR